MILETFTISENFIDLFKIISQSEQTWEWEKYDCDIKKRRSLQQYTSLQVI